MPESFLHLKAQEQSQIYRALAPQLARSPVVLEEDVWGCRNAVHSRRSASKTLGPGLRRDDVLSADGSIIVIPAQAHYCPENFRRAASNDTTVRLATARGPQRAPSLRWGGGWTMEFGGVRLKSSPQRKLGPMLTR